LGGSFKISARDYKIEHT